jgi:hypothetical protein
MGRGQHANRRHGNDQFTGSRVTGPGMGTGQAIGLARPGRARLSSRPGRLTSSRRLVGAGLWVVTFTLPAVTAYALWSANGTGTGAARATSATSLTVTAGSASADLYPGAAGNVVFSVTNPNPPGRPGHFSPGLPQIRA